MSPSAHARHLAAVCTLLAFAGCTADDPTPSEVAAPSASALAGSISPASVDQALAALRSRTASWHNRATAEADGYTVDVGCSDERTEGLTASQARGMGYHTLNPTLLDDHASLLEPELIVYDSNPASGHARMVAFDYFIPATALSKDAPAPSVEGIGAPMTFNDAHDGWIAHIWVWKHNKDGMFDNFNPDVPLCECEISPETNVCTPSA